MTTAVVVPASVEALREHWNVMLTTSDVSRFLEAVDKFESRLREAGMPFTALYELHLRDEHDPKVGDWLRDFMSRFFA